MTSHSMTTTKVLRGVTDSVTGTSLDFLDSATVMGAGGRDGVQTAACVAPLEDLYQRHVERALAPCGTQVGMAG